jgi:hypothetical protein
MPFRLTFIQQRSPRSFQYRPRYYRDPEAASTDKASHAERIRDAFRSQDKRHSFRERLENRRLMPFLDNSRAQMKLMRWVVLAGMAGLAYVALSLF